MSIGAAHGASLQPRWVHNIWADFDIRVGTPTLDQSHKIRDAGWFDDIEKQQFSLPITGDERAVRLAVWRVADASYRSASKRLMRVKANMSVKVRPSDTSADFSAAPIEIQLDPPAQLVVDASLWRDRIREASAILAGFDYIEDANVAMAAKAQTRFMVTTEGTRLVLPQHAFQITIFLKTTAADGMTVSVYKSFEGRTEAAMPDGPSLNAAVLAAAQRLKALQQATVIEPSTVPAILRGRAAAVFFHEVLGHRIEGHRQKDDDEGQTFTEMVGQPILPSFLSVTDDPTLKTLEDVALNGHYTHDDEGVAAQRVEVVKNGRLTHFLTSRTPIRSSARSNGHGRRQGGYTVVSRQGNLIVSAAETVPYPVLRAKLLAEVRRQGKAYGFIFEDISGGFTFTGRVSPNAFSVQPIGIVAVWADGRPDQLMRGADLIGTPLTTFQNILAASDQTQVFNGSCGAESGWVKVSAASPDLLISQVEVQLSEKAHDRPPLLPPPPASP